MKSVTISDTEPSRNILAFDLKEILRAIGPVVESLQWRLAGIDCTGEGSDELHELCDSDALVSGAHLVALSERILQTINGEFLGFRADAPDHATPWLIIRAVDSTAFDVDCDDPAVLSAVRRRFVDVRDMPA